jgi:hypothetical protein
VLEFAGQQQARILRQRSNRHIGKTRVAALRRFCHRDGVQKKFIVVRS